MKKKYKKKKNNKISLLKDLEKCLGMMKKRIKIKKNRLKINIIIISKKDLYLIEKKYLLKKQKRQKRKTLKTSILDILNLTKAYVFLQVSKEKLMISIKEINYLRKDNIKANKCSIYKINLKNQKIDY